MGESIKDLLARCLASESGAIAELVRRFQPWACGVATTVLGDPDLAEDAVQEAFLAALAHLPELREPEAFPGWFRQIVRTQAGRIAHKRREVSIEDANEPVAGEDSPRESLERAELRRIVHQALAELPPVGRRTAELFYLDERSCSDIAGLLQIPRGTVKRRLHDARRRLRAMLLGYVGDAGASGSQQKRKDGRFIL